MERSLGSWKNLAATHLGADRNWGLVSGFDAGPGGPKPLFPWFLHVHSPVPCCLLGASSLWDGETRSPRCSDSVAIGGPALGRAPCALVVVVVRRVFLGCQSVSRSVCQAVCQRVGQSASLSVVRPVCQPVGWCHSVRPSVLVSFSLPSLCDLLQLPGFCSIQCSISDLPQSPATSHGHSEAFPCPAFPSLCLCFQSAGRSVSQPALLPLCLCLSASDSDPPLSTRHSDPSVCLPVGRSVYRSVHLSVSPPVCLPVCLPANLPFCHSAIPSICLSLHLTL